MAKFFVDAFADMFGEELKNNGLFLAPSKIKIGKKIIDFDGWNKLSQEDVKDDIKKGKYSIVHITQQEWVDFFTPFLQEGEDIVFFTLSHALYTDGGCDLLSAFTQMAENFPDRKVKLVNTKTVSRGVSEIASFAKLVFDKEQDLEKAIKFATDLSGQFVTAFVFDDVEYIKNNPLLEKAGSHLTGGMVNNKPIISIDTKGNFKLLDKARGFKASVNKLFEIVKLNGENIADFTFTIVYMNAKEEALALKQKFLECVEENEIRVLPSSLNNAVIVGNKFVGVTFHSR